MQALIPLQTQFIVEHKPLAAGVYQVMYEAGTQVIVNYTDQPYQSGNIHVNANDFVVIP